MKDLMNTLSEIQIKYSPKVSAFDRPQIKSSQDAFIQFMLLLETNQFYIKEEAAVLYLNRANRVIGGYKLSLGGITGTIVDIRIILGIALKSLSCGIIIAHTNKNRKFDLLEIENMPAISIKKNKHAETHMVVDKNMRDYSNEPYFVKKAEKAVAFLKAKRLPKSFKKKAK